MKMIQNGDLFIWNDGTCSVTVNPRLGGKVKSFRSLVSGREFMWQDNRPNQDGTSYDAFDHSGWDECFPTIRPCEYPIAPFAGAVLPDHGWLWSATPSWDANGESLTVSVHFADYRLKLERNFSLLPDHRFVVHYKLLNEGNYPFVYLTDAHILFQWDERLHVEMPTEARMLYVYRSSRPDLVQPGTWERSGFWEEDFAGYNCKVFSPLLNQGKVLLHYPGECMEIGFDPISLPYVGLWIAKDFMDDSGRLIRCFSVQPTNLASATLPPAEWAGNCRYVLPGAMNEWTVTLRMIDEKPRPKSGSYC